MIAVNHTGLLKLTKMFLSFIPPGVEKESKSVKKRLSLVKKGSFRR